MLQRKHFTFTIIFRAQNSLLDTTFAKTARTHTERFECNRDESLTDRWKTFENRNFAIDIIEMFVPRISNLEVYAHAQ